jgi:hypothetical protein
MKARREEEAIITDGPRERGGGAMEGFLVLVQVGTGPMKGHSWLEFEVSRVFIAQQDVSCFLLKAEKLVCCAIK